MNSLTGIEVQSLFQQAASAYSNGDPGLAEKLARELTQREPLHADAHYLLGAIQLDHGDAIKALPLLETAIRLAPDHPGIRYALGNTYYALGQWSEAIQCYEPLRQIGRADIRVFLNLGIALHKIQQDDMAIQVLKQATRSYPSDASLWNAYADLLNKQNDDLAAIDAYERAVAIMPENPDYCANLALMYEQSNRMQDAESLALDMLKYHPQHPLLLLISIRCARRKKDYSSALTLLKQIPADVDLKFKRASLFEAGRIYDQQKKSDQAYACFLEGNKLTLDLWPNYQSISETYLVDMRSIRAYLDANPTLQWPISPSDSGRPQQVFLLGFMRSGTTLMDTMLEMNSGIKVLEEEDPIHDVIRTVTGSYINYPACLEQMPEDKIESLRNKYWQDVSRLIGPLDSNTIVLDKQPMLGPHAGLVHRIFPKAKFVFALRHPCDVVLSCFMQPFGNNPLHAHFTTLEKGATVYSLVMGIWLDYIERLSLDVHILRYEELVQNKHQALAEVFRFMELDDAQTNMDHVSHAKKRGRIYTPSYHQVVQPLYTDAMERWRRYQPCYESILPVLAPFIEQFGYSC